MMEENVRAYIALFRGRGDVYGNFSSPHAVREPLTPEHFQKHLCSPHSRDWIGVYPHLGNAYNQSVTWGCIDIDGKDFRLSDDEDIWNWEHMWRLATGLQAVLAVKDIYAHIERTRNGYHLWVFPERGVAPARAMRRALMAACKAVGYDPKEVNPKSEELAPGKIGNWVRLPYYGALSERDGDQPDRYFLDENQAPISLDEFLYQHVKVTSIDSLEAVATLWTPPQRVTVDGPPPEDLEPVLQTLSGLCYTMWKDGPLEGRDRSNTLAKLAYTLASDEVPAATAFAVVKNADERWGKFADRPDCDEQIMRFIERAYS